jgi:nickel-type superoxide dismutase maturation protease
MSNILPSSSFSELLFLFVGWRKRQRVVGNSMAPLLKQGDEVLLDPHAYRKHHPEIGEIVVARHPHSADFKIVKRVAFVDEDGGCFLVGDNRAASEDSRKFGVVSAEHLLGRVTSRFG